MYLPPEDRSLQQVMLHVAESIRPPERLTVSEAAAKYRVLKNRNAYSGPWFNSMVPYLVEPMDLLTSHDYDAVVFVGPAQCGKTEMFLNWLLYTVVCDPADMMLLEATQSRAADFSKLRLDRLHLDSPAIRERITGSKQRDNTFDKMYSNGVYLKLGWPTPTELSGKPISRMFLTDYDRMDQNVGGDGTPMILAQARTTTFGRYGMTLAESSPSHPITDPRWAPETPHEAPPAGGIAALYNEGDRRMWYWNCVNCDVPFQPDFDLLRWDTKDSDKYKGASTVHLLCPHCDHKYYHEPHGDTPGKAQMNQQGFWLRDGETVVRKEDGSKRIEGEASSTNVASFWLKGVAAAFQQWDKMVVNYIRAMNEYKRTGNEETLKATINVDQGRAYLPKSMESQRIPERLKRRAKELGKKVVPAGVRFLVASIDVQRSRFVVQVHGIGEGGDMWVVDRFDIKFSRRQADTDTEEDVKDQMDVVRPFTYAHDWRMILQRVLTRTYPLQDDSGRHMRIAYTICDSGGMNQATSNAYEFYRWLKRGPDERDKEYQSNPEEFEHWQSLWEYGVHSRFILYKGASTDTAPRVWIDHPDTKKKGKYANARGEIPVLMCNTTMMKDKADGMLDRTKRLHGRINFPKWLDLNFYKELCVEVKDPEKKGRWINPGKFRNESWDLLVMALSLLVSNRFNLERIDWGEPPDFALQWDDNPFVFDPNAKVIEKQPDSEYDIAELARKLA